MIGLFKYTSDQDANYRMPLEMLPPENLYRFKPDSKLFETRSQLRVCGRTKSNV
jgi:hypothetical protein